MSDPIYARFFSLLWPQNSIKVSPRHLKPARSSESASLHLFPCGYGIFCGPDKSITDLRYCIIFGLRQGLVKVVWRRQGTCSASKHRIAEAVV